MPKTTTDPEVMEMADLDLDDLDVDEYDGRTTTTVVLAKPIDHDTPKAAGSKVTYRAQMISREITYYVDKDGKEIRPEDDVEDVAIEERTRLEKHWVGPDGEHLARLIHIGVIAAYLDEKGKRHEVMAARQRDRRQLAVNAERGAKTHLTNAEMLHHIRTHRQTATIENERAQVSRDTAALKREPAPA